MNILGPMLGRYKDKRPNNGVNWGEGGQVEGVEAIIGDMGWTME